MGNQNEKEMIMTSLGKLKNVVEKFKRISVTDDYTAEERDAIKNKVTEARLWEKVFTYGKFAALQKTGST